MTQADLIRKTLIGMAMRRQRPGSGSSPEFLRKRTAHVQWPDIRTVLGNVPCAVIGAVATRHYMPERTTRDLDMIIAAPDAVLARRRLTGAGWKYKGDLRFGRSMWDSPEGLSLDLVEGSEPWWPAAISKAQRNLDIQGLPIIPLPYLVLMKFRAGRTLDVGDVTRVLGQATTQALGAVRELFRAEEPQGLEDLETLIYLGRLEMETG